jgi:hypothetical protein
MTTKNINRTFDLSFATLTVIVALTAIGCFSFALTMLVKSVFM